MKMTKPIKDGILNRKNILLLALGISTAGNLFLAKTLRQTTQERDRYLQALEWEVRQQVSAPGRKVSEVPALWRRRVER